MSNLIPGLAKITLTVTLSLLGITYGEETSFTEITLKADQSALKFDKTEFSVKAGSQVKLVFMNPEGSLQPHNVLIVKPGAAVRVGMLANRKMSNPEFMKKPNPKTPDVLVGSRLLQAGEFEVLEFSAPDEPGEYPYLCTYPGHWAVMKGIMKVEAVSK